MTVPHDQRRERLHRALPESVAGPVQLWLAGARRPSAGTMPTVDPTTGEALTDVAVAGEAEVEAVVAAAGPAGARWWQADGQDRARVLHRIAAAIRADAARLGLLDTLDAGRPIRDSRTGDVERAARIFEYFAGVTDRLRGSVVPVQPGRSNRVTLEPYGIVGAITPWNYPLTNAAGKIAPALATGNAVILKPAEQSPLSALRLAALAAEAGLPDGLLSVLNGSGAETGRLVAGHPGIGKLTFTGSTAVGRALGEAAGRLLKSVTLELGGKTAFLLFPDADLDAAAAALAFSLVNNAGQTCTAAARALVHRGVKDAFLERLADRLGKVAIGDPLDPSTRVGPIISAGQRERVAGFIANARTRGLAELELPGRRLPETGFFTAPAVFTDVSPADPLAQEEIFGPVGVVMPFDDEEEAVALANDSPYGLAASLWTDSAARIERLTPRLEAGLVWVNCVHALHPGSPYGGRKQSGLGLEMGDEAVQQHMRTKSVWVEHGRWRSPWDEREGAA